MYLVSQLTPRLWPDPIGPAARAAPPAERPDPDPPRAWWARGTAKRRRQADGVLAPDNCLASPSFPRGKSPCSHLRVHHSTHRGGRHARPKTVPHRIRPRVPQLRRRRRRVKSAVHPGA